MVACAVHGLALSSPSHALMLPCYVVFTQWENNDAVEVVLLKSNLDEFFCRGGDIKYLHSMAKDPATRAKALSYFREEYQLSHLIATYTKPVRSHVTLSCLAWC